MDDVDALMAKRAELDAQIEQARKTNRPAKVAQVIKDIRDYSITATELRSVLKTRKRKASTKGGEAEGEKKPRARRSTKDATE